MPTDLGILGTSGKADETFHRKRIMFCIKDGEVVLAPANTTMSHSEWFIHVGWVTTKESLEGFLIRTPRGFYLPSTQSVYCYQGTEFEFSNTTKIVLVSVLADLMGKLDLNANTTIHLGPKDAVVHGIHYPRTCLGILKDLLKTA